MNFLALLVGIALGFAAAVPFSKNLNRFWLKFKADPKGAVENEIAELKELADKLRSKVG